MKMNCLGSSSAGNCFVLKFDMGEGKEPLSLMVECGFPYQTIVRRATPYGIKLSNLGGVLITHSHNDHAIAARDLAQRGLQIYATQGTLEAVGLKGYGWPMHYGKPTTIAPGIKALAFRVNHDAQEPAGFIIKTKRETVMFAIDSNKWLDDVTSIAPDYLFIEANYDQTLMMQEQFSLQRRASVTDMQRYKLNERIKRSHMSIERCLSQISRLDKSRLQTVFLTHLSDHMSAPSVWKTQVTAITGVPCYVCRKDGGIE